MGDLVQAIGAAADAATVGRTRFGVAVNALSGMTIAEAKAMLPGSIVKLNDDSWALVPVASGVVLAGDGTSWLVAVKTKDGRSTRHTADWMSDNVRYIIPGVLTVDGRCPARRHTRRYPTLVSALPRGIELSVLARSHVPRHPPTSPNLECKQPT